MVVVALARVATFKAGGKSFVEVLLMKTGWALAGALGWVSDSVLSVISVQGLLRENRGLKLEVRNLKDDLERLTEEAREVERLRSLLRLKRDSYPQGLAASVIGRSAELWIQALIINRGTEAGFKSGDYVVNQEGLVGTLKDVGPGSSTVRLVTASDFSLSVLGQQSRDQGVVKGNGAGYLTLKYLRYETQVRVGEKIVTVGSGPGMKGIPIGEVVSVKQSGTFNYEIVVKPLVNINRIEDLLVIKSSGR